MKTRKPKLTRRECFEKAHAEKKAKMKPIDIAGFEKLYACGIIAPWYLRDSQQRLYLMLRNEKKVVAKCHRRFGKGTTILTYILERCLEGKILVRYGAETQKQAFDILAILFDHIYHYAPRLKPELKNGIYQFATGSQIFVFGCGDSAQLDRARGVEADIIFCDEYAFWKYKPSYVLKSVLSPQLDTTDGQLIVASTPPIDLTHPYVEQVAEAEATKKLFTWTILESLALNEITKERHDKIIERCGGIDTDDYRREYLCEMIPNRNVLVIPEAQNQNYLVPFHSRPSHFDWQAMFDLGFVDYFAGLWYYLDFQSARMIIESEIWIHYQSTREITNQCRQIETMLGIEKVSRKGDCSDQQQLFDMAKDHGYPVSPITKRSKQTTMGFRDSVINQLRIGVMSNKILIVEPNCPNLIKQLKYGLWNERRTDFERTETMGHLDLLMCLAYAYDNIDWQKNPFPNPWANASRIENFINPHHPTLKPKASLGRLVGK
jgi:hypothetical protein